MLFNVYSESLAQLLLDCLIVRPNMDRSRHALMTKIFGLFMFYNFLETRVPNLQLQLSSSYCLYLGNQKTRKTINVCLNYHSHTIQELLSYHFSSNDRYSRPLTIYFGNKFSTGFGLPSSFIVHFSSLGKKKLFLNKY